MENNRVRRIAETVTGSKAVDGAGVNLVRVLGHETTSRFDPFLMLDAFDSVNPEDYIRGFPWHPHRGIETVTLLISGRIDHGDSLGNKGTITGGGCQWMTAGSGIVHQEMPRESDRLLGLQLWLNLPQSFKMTAPAYHDIEPGNVPEITGSGSKVRIIAGSFQGKDGTFRGTYVDATLLDISLDPGAELSVPVREDETAFAYLVSGKISFDAETASERRYMDRRQAIRLENGNLVCMKAESSEDARVLFFAAKPLREPIAWGGPIVMNTREELDRAYKELNEGTFIQ
jgi:redox-sensitive bicupin YhaK (pirin superfamily)